LLLSTDGRDFISLCALILIDSELYIMVASLLPI